MNGKAEENVASTATTMSQARPPLDRDTIVAAAIVIADAEGVGKLSMRHLARTLGYEVMSLYNHVANKNELLTLMVDAVAAEIGEPPDLDPIDAIRHTAVATHTVLLRHPWAPDLWLRHLPGPERNRTMEDLLRLLDESGLDEELAHFGFHAVNNHVLGHALQHVGMTLGIGDDPQATMDAYLASLSTEGHPHVIAHVHQHQAGQDGNSFELALDLILDGLVRLNDER